jgi:hypothetical protein
MEDNIIKIGKSTIIINGGNPLSGCPESFAKAEEWSKEANGDRDQFSSPMWSWDCGFKLDFDGPLLRINSRFYPPKTHYGPTWDGNVSVMIGGEIIEKKAFDCTSLDELRNQVEAYIESVKSRIILKPE